MSFPENREKLYRQREQRAQRLRGRRVWGRGGGCICQQFIVAGAWGPNAEGRDIQGNEDWPGSGKDLKTALKNLIQEGKEK